MSGDGWNFWLYLATCLAVPAAWGVCSAWLFNRLDKRKPKTDGDRPVVDYTI